MEEFPLWYSRINSVSAAAGTWVRSLAQEFQFAAGCPKKKKKKESSYGKLLLPILSFTTQFLHSRSSLKLCILFPENHLKMCLAKTKSV